MASTGDGAPLGEEEEDVLRVWQVLPIRRPEQVHRIEMRLFEADKELGCARAVYWQRRGKWLRERSLDVLGKRLGENPEDLDMIILWQT